MDNIKRHLSYILIAAMTAAFVIESFSTENGEDPICEYGDTIKAVLRLKSKTDVQNVFLRFEVKYQDQTRVGTMFSNRGFNCYANKERIVHLGIDTEHLASGRYVVDIIAYQFNEFGKERFLDGVYPGVIVEITETINNENKLIWLHRYWGHVHLNDVIIDQLGVN